MKRLIVGILSLSLAVAMLAGCSNNTTPTTEPSGTPETTATQPSEPAEQPMEQSQIDKALALIGTFASGDTATASELLADGYIQHNLAYGTGADAFIGSVEYLASAEVKSTVNNIRAFEDGDKVFLQTIYKCGNR